MPNASRSKVQLMLDSWDEETKTRFCELYNNFTPHKEIGVELNIQNIYMIGLAAKMLGLSTHKKGHARKAKPKPNTVYLAHTWEVNSRRRTCTVCGFVQYKSTKFCSSNPSHLAWLPAYLPSCTSSSKA